MLIYFLLGRSEYYHCSLSFLISQLSWALWRKNRKKKNLTCLLWRKEMKVFHVFLKGLYVLVNGVRGHAPDLEKNMSKNILLKISPTLTSPLCWINMVSQVRFPWMIGSWKCHQECILKMSLQNLQQNLVTLKLWRYERAERICVHQRRQDWNKEKQFNTSFGSC